MHTMTGKLIGKVSETTGRNDDTERGIMVLQYMNILIKNDTAYNEE